MSWRDHLREAIFPLSAYRPVAVADGGVLRMDANESALPVDPEDLAAFGELARSIPYHRYPEATGKPLREALAARWGVSPEEVLAGNGSDEIIQILLTAFARGPEPKVLFPTPTFGMYDIVAQACGVAPIRVPLRQDWQLDEDACREALRRQAPGLAFFASPNNPTGNRFAPDALERLARAAPGCFVVDEAYADFAGFTQVDLIERIPGLCVMKSLSKIGFAGLRLGALLGPADLIAELDKVRLPYNVNAASMAFACAALSAPERIEARVRKIVTARKKLEAGLARLPGLTVFPSDANFVLVRTLADSGAVHRALLAHGVLVRDMGRPGAMRNCLRITAGDERENERCLQALAAALAETRPAGA